MQEKSFAFERKAAYLSDAMVSEKVGPYWLTAAARIRRHIKGDRGAQGRLASRAGITEATFSRFLDARLGFMKAPSLDQAARIAKALEWPLQELLADPNAQQPLSEPPEVDLPPEVLEAVRDLLETAEHHRPRKSRKARSESR